MNRFKLIGFLTSEQAESLQKACDGIQALSDKDVGLHEAVANVLTAGAESRELDDRRKVEEIKLIGYCSSSKVERRPEWPPMPRVKKDARFKR